MKWMVLPVMHDVKTGPMTDREKMLSGNRYNPTDGELEEIRLNVHSQLNRYNLTRDDEQKLRREILESITGYFGEHVIIQPPVYFDYGNLFIGDGSFINFRFTAIDCAKIEIGENVLIGPGVTLATAMHPMLAEERKTKRHPDGKIYGMEYALPVRIGNHVWIGSSAVILPGVSIGEGTVIGAGSVVTRDIPEGVLAVGNPCRVVRKLTKEDAVRIK